MPPLALDPPPHEPAALIEPRRQSGLDQFDEAWEGALHMVPARSRVHGHIESQLRELLRPPARAARVEMTGQCNPGYSDHDFRWQKLPFYGEHRSVDAAA